MLNVRCSYVSSLQRKATGAGTFTATLPKVDSHDYILVRGIGVINDTSGGSQVSVGIQTGGVNFYFQTLTLTNAGDYYKLSGTLVVPKQYALVFKFEGHAAGDKYTVNVSGEMISNG